MIRTVSGSHVVVIGGDEDAVDDDDNEEGLGAALMYDVSRQSPMSTSSTPMIVRRKSLVSRRRRLWSCDAGTSSVRQQLCCVSYSADDVKGEVDRGTAVDQVDQSRTLDVTDRLDSPTLTSDKRPVATGVDGTASIEDQLDCAGVLASSAAADDDQRTQPGAANFSSPLPCGVAGVGYRLGLRNTLSERRKRIADYSLVCALFGLTVVVAETEMLMADVYDKVSQSFDFPAIAR